MLSGVPRSGPCSRGLSRHRPQRQKRLPTPLAKSAQAASAAKREVRVAARGVARNRAVSRSTLIAAAVVTCCRRAPLGTGGLTVESRTDRVSVYGGLDLTRDKRGLAHARELEALPDRVVRAP